MNNVSSLLSQIFSLFIIVGYFQIRFIMAVCVEQIFTRHVLLQIHRYHIISQLHFPGCCLKGSPSYYFYPAKFHCFHPPAMRRISNYVLAFWSIHFPFGLPVLLFPGISLFMLILAVLLSFILLTCPNHLSLNIWILSSNVFYTQSAASFVNYVFYFSLLSY